MPREILQGAREMFHNAENVYDKFTDKLGDKFAAEPRYLHGQENVAHANVPVPLGYRREVHVHTVLVPEHGALGWMGTSLAWFTANWIPLLAGALILGTALWLFSKLAGRAARVAKERTREFAEFGRAKARDVAESTKIKAQNLAEFGREKAYDMQAKAYDMKAKAGDVKERLKEDVKRRANKAKTLKDDLIAEHERADFNRGEQLRMRVAPAEADLDRVQSRRGMYVESQEFEERPIRSRIAEENLESIIGETELEKHQRGAEYAEFEDEAHTARGQDEYIEEEVAPIVKKRPTKIVTTKITTEVEQPKISKKRSMKALGSDEGLLGTTRVIETSTE